MDLNSQAIRKAIEENWKEYLSKYGHLYSSNFLSGITAQSLFVGMSSFSPTSSATIKANANKNPPLPWFQLKLKESGNAINAKTIGLEINPIPIMRFLCIV